MEKIKKFEKFVNEYYFMPDESTIYRDASFRLRTVRLKIEKEIENGTFEKSTQDLIDDLNVVLDKHKIK